MRLWFRFLKGQKAKSVATYRAHIRFHGSSEVSFGKVHCIWKLKTTVTPVLGLELASTKLEQNKSPCEFIRRCPAENVFHYSRILYVRVGAGAE